MIFMKTSMETLYLHFVVVNHKGDLNVERIMTKDEFIEEVKKFCKKHYDAIVKDMMQKLGYTDLNKLHEDYIHMKWGFDCGWILVTPKNKEMRELWGDYPKTIMPVAYETQSLNIQQPQVDYILKGLGWEDDFRVEQHLD